ncbi:SapC family protein [Aliiglaciecola sp. 3_MG-2023]|uniref:SapC family protein n=1 Tax=Aliiglaciecola sp. 3_MG-2023 TaxID=3062644 RepID=UPI0026E44A03|nr:SapC family protein [Aliiglaciecola sp. 3_MG-2023]MDO6694141.1 SapC family protein [Aliiglaciecola sp. 3_MG-2023]
MPNHQLLDNITHKDLQVITDFLPNLGDDISFTNVFVSEFREAQGLYPLFFHKHTETGKFEAIALFGFAPFENLYLNDSGWQGNYIPLTIRRRPFLIGFQNVQVDGVLTQDPVVFVDMDSPRVSQTTGEKVFLEQGGQSDYLQNINSILQTIHQGHRQTDEFIDTILQHNLVEQVSIKVQLKDGSNHELNSLYTVNEEKVAALHGDVLQSLHQQGYLQMMHMMEASMSNLSLLIEKKNATL